MIAQSKQIVEAQYCVANGYGHDAKVYREITYRIAGNFGGELNLAVWRMNYPTVKLKSANIKSCCNATALALVGVVS